MSSVNPVIILPRALQERSNIIAKEFTDSCLMGTGQFCTNPGLVILIDSPETEQFISRVTVLFGQPPAGTLLSAQVLQSLKEKIIALVKAGANIEIGGNIIDGKALRFENTLLSISGQHFLTKPNVFQAEAFGNASLIVVAQSEEEAAQVINILEGNLTGSIYSSTDFSDDKLYDLLASCLRQRVGRLLNDKMPTGVAVSQAMNHGGPFPATGHPLFTAVGIPASLSRFGTLQCYDKVRQHRLPDILRDDYRGAALRDIDGMSTQNVS